jgi:AcrR family transcriptional regulator
MPKVVDSDRRRTELAEAAARVIARHGIDGAALRTVAAEAGWTTGALVPYFATKRELLAFTLQASLERRRARRAERAEMSPSDALRDVLVSPLPTTADARLHWTVTLAFAGQASSDERLAAIQRDAYLDFRASVVELLVEARALTVGEAEGEAERLIAVVNGVALQALFAPELWSAERQVGAVDDALADRRSPGRSAAGRSAAGRNTARRR